MHPIIVYSIVVFLLSTCQQSNGLDQLTQSSAASAQLDTPSISKVSDIPLPNGYKRIAFSSNHFAEYTRQLTFDPDDVVHLYNGEAKSYQEGAYKVLDIDVGDKDLQQCADAVIRLRAEYLFKEKRFGEICFNFTNGAQACWLAYAAGKRPFFDGNKTLWQQSAAVDHSHKNFRKYLDLLFMYCGTYSLHRDMKKPEAKDKIEPGDVFIQSRQPYGHAVMVLDVAENENGDRLCILAQSYMPAQQIHVLKNLNARDISPWYSFNGTAKLTTPEWTFSWEDRRKF